MRRGRPSLSAPFRPAAGVLTLGILVAVSPFDTAAAFACSPTFEFACQIGQKIGQDAHDAGHAIAKSAREFGVAVGKGAHEFGAAVGKGVHDAGNAFGKATQGQGADASPSGPTRAP